MSSRPINLRFVLIVVGLILISASDGRAQATPDAGIASNPKKEAEESSSESQTPNVAQGLTFANPVKHRWRVGVQIKGGVRSAKNFLITIPVPNQWPEQQVAVYEEDIPAEIRSVKYRDLNSGVRQLVVTVPKVGAGELITMTVTFDVAVQQILGPTDKQVYKSLSVFRGKSKNTLASALKSPIATPKLRNQVKKLIEDVESDWHKVESIFDWVRDNIEYSSDDPSDSLSVFRKRSGAVKTSSVYLWLCVEL